MEEMMQVIEVPPNIHVHHIMSSCTCVCHRYIVVNLAGKYMYMYVHEKSVIETRQMQATTPEDNFFFPEKKKSCLGRDSNP